MGLCTSRKQHLEPEDLYRKQHPEDLSSPGPSFLSSYHLHEKLGSGGFGTVYRVTHKDTGTQRVAKKIKRDPEQEEPSEVNLMRELDHPQIIGFLEHYTSPFYQILILELLPGCMDLFDYIGLRGKLPERSTKFIMIQLTAALTYLHEEKQIAHLDVKPENILIQPTTGDTRLIDFGAAQRIRPRPHTTFRGTRQYASPEILFSGKFDPVAADVWAVGVTLYKMIYGRLPFKRSRDYLRPLSFFHTGVSTLCLETIAIILNPNPDLRPASISDIRSSYWLQS